MSCATREQHIGSASGAARDCLRGFGALGEAVGIIRQFLQSWWTDSAICKSFRCEPGFPT